MQSSDYIAIAALIVASLALCLQARKWFESIPRLKLSIMADAKFFPPIDEDQRSALMVTNRGHTPTEITQFVVYGFKSPIHRLFRISHFAAIIKPGPLSCEIPFKIDANKTWRGLMIHNDESNKLLESGQFYLGVTAAHSDKIFLKRASKPKSVAKNSSTTCN